jgi:GTPase SAR1 family protein
MGGFLQKEPHKICVLGLDAAGKTTFAYQWADPKPLTEIPTMCFSHPEVLNYHGMKLSVLDLGGMFLCEIS